MTRSSPHVNGFDVNVVVDTAGEPSSAAATSTVSTGSRGPTSPSVAIDSNGDAVVAWETPGDLPPLSRRPTVPQVVPGINRRRRRRRGQKHHALGRVRAQRRGDDRLRIPQTAAIRRCALGDDDHRHVVDLAIQVATDTTFLAVQVAFDSSGEATAAYSGFDGTDSDYDLRASELPPGGTQLALGWRKPP